MSSIVLELVMYLGGRFGYSLLFSARGGWWEGGEGSILLKIPRGGGGSPGAGGVSVANWGILGGGGKTGRRVKQVQCGKLAF